MNENLDVIKEPGAKAPSPLAQKEELKFKRDESLRNALNYGIVLIIKSAGFIFLVILIVRVYHMLAPHSWEWLDDNELQEIDKILYSGAIGGFIGNYIKKSNET